MRTAAATGVVVTLVALAAMPLASEPFTLCHDNAGVFHGLGLEAWRAWTAGRVPHWTDTVWGGFPLIGDSATAALYLPHVVPFLATAPPHLRVFDVAMALHLGVLAAGSVRLLGLLGAQRRAAVVGGLLAALTPYPHWGAVSFFPVFGAQAWWPWTLVAAEELARPGRAQLRRALVTGWIAIAAQMFAGVPEQMTYGAAVAACWVLLRRTGLSPGARLGRLAALGIGAAALAAPQLLPTALHFATTGRTEPPAMAGLASLWLTDPLALVVAGWGVMNRTPSFFGVATLGAAAVALLGRRPRPLLLAVIAAGGFLVALGPQTPVEAWFRLVPPFGHFRSPVKLLAFAELAVVWLAALGIDRLASGARPRARLVAAALALAALTEHAVYVRQEIPALREVCRAIDDSAATLRTLEVIEPARGTPGAPRPLVLDLYVGGIDTFARGFAAVSGMNSLTGGRPALLSRRHERLLVFRVPTRPMLDLFGARWVLVRPPQCDEIAGRLGLVVAERHDAICVLESPRAPSRYAFLDAAVRVESEHAMIQAVLAWRGGPVPVLAPSGAPLAASAAGARARVVAYEPGTIALDVETAEDGLLLVRHSWAPGWRATVDGAEVPVYQAAGLYFAVPVPAGRHQVTLRYRTPGFVPGLAVAVLFVLAAIAWSRRLGGASTARVC